MHLKYTLTSWLCIFFHPCYSFVQVEFMAEDESINIVPNVRMDTLHMICVGVIVTK